MIKITDAGNVMNYAIDLIVKDDYQVYSPKYEETFIAKKQNTIIKADDPLSLLSVLHLQKSGIEPSYKSTHIDQWSQLSLKELLSLGYKVHITDKYSEEWFNLVGKKSEIELIAGTPLKLYALHLIIQTFGKRWNLCIVTNYMQNIFNLP